MSKNAPAREQGEHPAGELEIAEDIDFQRRTWTVQRIGWVGIALIALASLLGLFGPGLLGRSVAGDRQSSLWMEYSRFERSKGEAMLRIYLGPLSAPENKARLWVSREYLDGVQLRQVTPEPESVEAGPDRMTFVFRLSDPGRPTAVTFYVEPEKVGRLPGRVGLADEQPINFSQFIYPYRRG